MFPESWKEGLTEELIELAHIQTESLCEQPAHSASNPQPSSPGNWDHLSQKLELENPSVALGPFYLARGELFPLVSIV